MAKSIKFKNNIYLDSSGVMHKKGTTRTPLNTYLNGIIESGSNENGSWAKSYDGTMMCRKTFSIGELAPNAVATAGWLFPVAPINIDYQVIGQLRTGANNWDYLRSIFTYVDLRGVTINVKNTSSLIADASTWDFVVIGKWK